MIFRSIYSNKLCAGLTVLTAVYCLFEMYFILSEDSHLVREKDNGRSADLNVHVMELDLDIKQDDVETDSPTMEMDFETTGMPLLDTEYMNSIKPGADVELNLYENVKPRLNGSIKNQQLSYIFSKYSAKFDIKRLQMLNRIPYDKFSNLNSMPRNLIGVIEKFTSNPNFRIPEVEKPYPDVCNGSAPFILTIVLSGPDHRLTRQIIRQTWGSVVGNKSWPYLGSMKAPVSLLFVIGHKNVTPPLNDLLLAEQRQHKDILFVNVTESYRNLTQKMLSVLNWVNNCCPGTPFILKVDEDSFVNMPLLTDFLLHHQANLSRSVIGNVYKEGKVFRQGKWAVQYSAYPFYFYPPYCSGSSYILSGDVIPELLQAVKVVAPIPTEDAYITGILAWVAGIPKVSLPALAVFEEFKKARGHPELCQFFETRLAITDVTVEVYDRIWLAIQMGYCQTKGHNGLDPFVFGDSKINRVAH